jgi:hypothetical protein
LKLDVESWQFRQKQRAKIGNQKPRKTLICCHFDKNIARLQNFAKTK